MKTPAVLCCALALGCASAQAAETARYKGLEPDRFMTRWIVLAPIPVSESAPADEDAPPRSFTDDLLAAAGGEAAVDPAAGDTIRLAGSDRKWRPATADGDVVDLGAAADGLAVGYAWAEIEMAEATPVVLGVGSDDAVKIWVNGTPVHEHWVARATRPDEDLVRADLHKGRNRLLLKILNIRGKWGFACRPLGREGQRRRLLAAARTGDLETAKLLLDGGAAVDGRGPGDVTAVHVARLHGRQGMVDFLAGRGADITTAIPARELLVDALFNEAFKASGPGAAVLVAKDGKVLFEKGYGRTDIHGGAAITPDTRFRIGSVTKQFTAAAILKLSEQGKLGLQDKLSRFIPDYPRAGEVTIHHLLTHTSGIHNFTAKPEFYASATQGARAEEHIASFKNDPYDFAPGTRWSYSNSGYFLLGYLVEKASGQSYADYLQQTFFAPLGLRDTGVHERRRPLANEALGYAFMDRGADRASDWDMSKIGGAGALYSTVRDLHRWSEAIFGGRVLGEAALQAAFTPVVTADDDPTVAKGTGYGYGWAIQKLRGAPELSHGGGLPGFASYLLRLPESRFTVVILTNAGPPPPGADAAVLARDVAEIYLGDGLPARETPRIDPGVGAVARQAVVGRYDLGGATLVVTDEGGRMFAQLAGLARKEIFPRSETAFFVKGSDREITFVKNASGRVTTAVVTNQAGQSMSAARIDEVPPPSVDSEAYQAYVGRYDYGHQAVLTVSREGGRLMAQLTSQPRFEIFPRSGTTFFWKVVNAEIEFVKDASGKVVKAIHTQGGRTFDVRRLE